jgi:hypothetical protein
MLITIVFLAHSNTQFFQPLALYVKTSGNDRDNDRTQADEREIERTIISLFLDGTFSIPLSMDDLPSDLGRDVNRGPYNHYHCTPDSVEEIFERFIAIPDDWT